MRTAKASQKSPKAGETVVVKTTDGQRVEAVYDGQAYLVNGAKVEVDTWYRAGKTAGKVGTTLAASAPANRGPVQDKGILATVRAALGF
jgi:hypothetical protein